MAAHSNQFPYVSNQVLVIAIIIVTLMIIKQHLPVENEHVYKRSVSTIPMEERKLTLDWTNLGTNYGKAGKGGKGSKGGKNGKRGGKNRQTSSKKDDLSLAKLEFLDKDDAAKAAKLKPYKYDFFKCGDYEKQCLDLFEKLRHPDASLITSSPPKQIPEGMMDDFTQNGALPLRASSYLNEASNSSNSSAIEEVSNSELSSWIQQAMKNKAMSYKSHNMRKAFFTNADKIRDKSMVVVGTQQVWVEAMALMLNASRIVTLDYSRKKYQNPKLSWYHVNDFLDKLIADKETQVFDNAASFSSIEHSGLGRYGDALSPNGDLDTMKQVHCMMKPGGLFFLGVPTTEKELGFLDFNLHRYYGKKRLELMFQGWTLVNQTEQENHHSVFILKKEKLC